MRNEVPPVATAALWSFFSKGTTQALQFAVSVALARLVAPEAFGLLAMVSAVVGFLTVIGDLGIGAAIIQRRDLDAAQTQSAFNVTVLGGAALSALALGAAPLIAAFYGRRELSALASALSLTFVITGIGVVPRATLLRELSMRRVALVDVASVTLGSLAALTMAMLEAGVWALVASTLVSAAASSALFVTAARPRLRLSLTGDFLTAGPLLRVGGGLLAFSALNYWARSLDNVLIGLWFGERSLAMYAGAYALMLLPITQITSVLGNAMLPAMAHLQDDPAEAKRLFLRAIGLTSYVAFPAMLGLWSVATPFVDALFGPRWHEMTPILEVLAPIGALQCVVNPVGWIFLSKGRTDLMFRSGLFSSTVTVAAIAVGAMAGSPRAVAVAYGIANLLISPPIVAYAGRLLALTVAELLREVRATFLAASAMALAVRALALTLPPGLGSAPTLALLVAFGVLFYGLACRFAHPSAAGDALGLIERWLGGSSPRLLTLARVLLTARRGPQAHSGDAR